MHVLMLTDFYQPYIGGVEQHVRSLSWELCERGHQVSIATLWDGKLEKEERDGPIAVHRLQGAAQRLPVLFSNPGRMWAPPLPDPEIVVRLARLVRRLQPDVIHGHDWLARSYAPVKRALGKPFFLGLHYYTVSCPKKDLLRDGRPCEGPSLRCIPCSAAHYGLSKGVLTLAANSAASRFESNLVDCYLPVTEAVAAGNQLAERQLPYVVVSNFLPNKLPGQRGANSDYTALLPHEPFLLFVGDLRAYKGIEVLLEAYSGLQNPPPLVLIGKVWPQSPRTLPSNVKLLQNWPNWAVMQAWRRAFAGVVPSIGPEAFGLAALEAMSHGCPIVASNVGGIPEIVKHQENGLLVTPGDPMQLRNALQRMIDQPGLRDRLGARAARTAANYAAEAVVPRFEAVYERALRPVPCGVEQVILT